MRHLLGVHNRGASARVPSRQDADLELLLRIRATRPTPAFAVWVCRTGIAIFTGIANFIIFEVIYTASAGYLYKKDYCLF